MGIFPLTSPIGLGIIGLVIGITKIYGETFYWSQVYGSKTSKQSFAFICDFGQYIDEIFGRSGCWMDAVASTCFGSPSQQYGGLGGSPTTAGNCPGGYTGVNICDCPNYYNFNGQTVPFVSQIQPICPTATTSSMLE
jgi:hypothetical protein